MRRIATIFLVLNLPLGAQILAQNGNPPVIYAYNESHPPAAAKELMAILHKVLREPNSKEEKIHLPPSAILKIDISMMTPKLVPAYIKANLPSLTTHVIIPVMAPVPNSGNQMLDVEIKIVACNPWDINKTVAPEYFKSTIRTSDLEDWGETIKKELIFYERYAMFKDEGKWVIVQVETSVLNSSCNRVEIATKLRGLIGQLLRGELLNTYVDSYSQAKVDVVTQEFRVKHTCQPLSPSSMVTVSVEAKEAKLGKLEKAFNSLSQEGLDSSFQDKYKKKILLELRKKLAPPTIIE